MLKFTEHERSLIREAGASPEQPLIAIISTLDCALEDALTDYAIEDFASEITPLRQRIATYLDLPRFA